MEEARPTCVAQEAGDLVPAELGKPQSLKADAPVMVVGANGELRTVSRMQAIRAAQAIAVKYKKPGVSVVDEFIRERHEAAARE